MCVVAAACLHEECHDITGFECHARVTGDGDAVQLSNLVLSLRSGAGTPSGFAVPVVQVPAPAP